MSAATTPPRDGSPFLVSSLNSFHRFAKGAKAAARRNFEVMNDGPKIPSLFTALKATTKPKKPSTAVKRDTSKDTTSPTSNLRATRTPIREETKRKVDDRVPRQLCTPPSERVMRREPKPPPRFPVKASIALKKTQDSSKPVATVRQKSFSPTPTRSTQLATPPSTPPLASVASKVAPKSIGSRVPTVKKADRSVVREASPTTRVMVPKMQSAPVSAIPKRVVMKRAESARKPVPCSIVVPTVGSRNKASTEARKPPTAEVPITIEEPTDIVVAVEAEASMEEEGVIEYKAPAEAQVPIESTAAISPERVGTAPETPAEAPAICEPTVEIEIDIFVHAAGRPEDSKTEDEIVPHVATSLLETVEESPSATVNPTFALEELKHALTRRREANVSPQKPKMNGSKAVGEMKNESTPRVQKREATENDISVGFSKDNNTTRDENKSSACGVSTGIQARMAALLGSATGSRNALTPAPGAYVRRFKIPELGEDDQASKNRQIQREVEALRTLKRVGNGSSILVKTRAFGGSLEANYAVDDEQPQGPSLEFVAIMERVRKEKARV